MQQNTLIIVTLLQVAALLGCDKKSAPAYTMTDAERQKAQAITGWWNSTNEDVGFSGNLKPDGSASVSYGTSSVESIKGPWWVASSPERLVIQREDGTLAEFKIIQAGTESMKLQAVSGGQTYTLSKALVVTPK